MLVGKVLPYYGLFCFFIKVQRDAFRYVQHFVLPFTCKDAKMRSQRSLQLVVFFFLTRPY